LGHGIGEMEQDGIPQSINVREAEGEASIYGGDGLLDLAMIADGEPPFMRIHA